MRFPLYNGIAEIILKAMTETVSLYESQSEPGMVKARCRMQMENHSRAGG